jgi:uncharacterized protein YjbJ (UPF0337 family)
MDKDRIAGSAKDFAGKVEGALGDIAGDAKTQAAGRAREATGTVQNLYGQAKDAAVWDAFAATYKSYPDLPAHGQSQGRPASTWPYQDRKHRQISVFDLVDD